MAELDKKKRADQAKRILEDPLFNEMLEKLENQLIKEWKLSGPEDTQRREDAWRSWKLLVKLKTNIESVMKTGEMQDREITRDPSNFDNILSKVGGNYGRK